MMKKKLTLPGEDSPTNLNEAVLAAQIDDIHHRVLGGIDPRDRTQSLDRHLKGAKSTAFTKLLSVFKATSGGESKIPKNSIHKSGSAEAAVTNQPARRKFVRVVRDENAPPPEVGVCNPHTTAKYSQEYLKTYYDKKAAASAEDLSVVKRCPYTTTGHTILKKSSGDQIQQPGDSPNATAKHATFFAEVEVIEFTTQDEVAGHRLSTHTAPLRDSLEEMTDGPLSSGRTSPPPPVQVTFGMADDLEDANTTADCDKKDTNEVFEANESSANCDNTELPSKTDAEAPPSNETASKDAAMIQNIFSPIKVERLPTQNNSLRFGTSALAIVGL